MVLAGTSTAGENAAGTGRHHRRRDGGAIMNVIGDRRRGRRDTGTGRRRQDTGTGNRHATIVIEKQRKGAAAPFFFGALTL